MLVNDSQRAGYDAVGSIQLIVKRLAASYDTVELFYLILLTAVLIYILLSYYVGVIVIYTYCILRLFVSGCQ